jgi:lipopolysaccharide transport system ATP-binding protein
VLIVDEALSVGDVYFQHKCIARIREFKTAGTTLLFVSHDAAAVKTLCDRAILLDRGELRRDGSPDAVLDFYNALIARREASHEILQVEAAAGGTATRSGTFEARIADVDLVNAGGEPARAFLVGERVHVRCLVEFLAPVVSPTVGMLVRDRLGNDVFGTNTYHLAPIEGRWEPGDELSIDFEVELNLGPGTYTLTVAVHSHATHMLNNYDWWDKVVGFEVLPGGQPVFVGTAWLPVRARVTRGRRSLPAS